MQAAGVRRRKNEEGALLIILMVGVAVAMIGIAVAFQSWSIVWRRDSEEELIFRGQQYADAIRAYRKEHGNQCPPNLEELMKPGPRQVRYIRKLYKDPMVKGGKWGLLYMMPGGNAIYDPIAALQAKNQKDSGAPLTDDATIANPNSMPGVTMVNDPMGTGLQQQQGSVPMSAGVTAGMGGGGQNQGALGRLQQMQGGGFGGVRASGGQFGGVGQMVVPPPMPAPSGSDDDKTASEPPIGWPIVGVISRANGKTAEDTYKIYKGHEHVNEWQFHALDQGSDQGQAPMGTLPGGSPPPFIGPGFGGTGPINGMGPGSRPGGGPRFGPTNPGGGPGGGNWNPNNPWMPGQKPGGNH
jgi:type II secretory pathway pseudopilin PulG